MRKDVKKILSNYSDRDELDEKLDELRNDFYNKVDPFLAEIPESRSERNMYAEKIYNHEDRIEALETWQKTQVQVSI